MSGEAELPISGRRKSVAQERVSSVLGGGEIPVYSRQLDADEEVLAALGYKPEFRREFSLWTTFCVSFAVLGLLPSFASTLYYVSLFNLSALYDRKSNNARKGMGYAGTPGMVWGWLIAMAFIQCVAMSMAELCSSMPTSGGLYYASAVLAPPGYGPLAAWLTGWSNWMAQVTGAPSVDYALAAMILAAGSIGSPGYVPENYQIFLLTVILLLIHACISSMPTRWIANFNSVGSTLNIIALIVVIILIPAAANREARGLPKFNASADVWGEFYPGADFPNGLALLMSFVAVIWTMSGYDAPFHLSEECSNANVASPRAIVLSSGIGGLFGWFLQLVVAYTVIDIKKVIDSDLGQPWASYLLQVMPQKTALAILALTIMCAFSMGQGCMVAASRVTYAYARDDCFPASHIIKRVNRHTQTPVNAVWFNTSIGIFMVLLIFGGKIAVGALFSIAAVGAFVAFTIPIFIRVFFVGNRFRPGPWNLGKFSYPIGVAACSFVVLMVPILMLPSVRGKDLNATTMNWTCLVYGGPMLGVIVWWIVDAHKWFKGPKASPPAFNLRGDVLMFIAQVNIEHQMLGQENNVIEGRDELRKGSPGSSSGSIGEANDAIKAGDLA